MDFWGVNPTLRCQPLSPAACPQLQQDEQLEGFREKLARHGAGKISRHGNVMGMSWECHGNVMGMSWECHGNVMGMSWEYAHHISSLKKMKNWFLLIEINHKYHKYPAPWGLFDHEYESTVDDV